MAIIQENRFNAPHPEVTESEYGVQYVKAATETPVAGEPEEEKPEAEATVETGGVVEEKPAETPVAVKKKTGRPRKDAKKR